MNNAWPWLYANNNNGLLGGAGGWGAGILGFLIGTLFNGGWGNGFGFGGNGGNGAAAASLGAQATAYNNADLIMQAVTSQGEQSRQAVQTLSNALGQDFNLVNGAINTIQTSLATIAANQGMNALQVINAIQSGDANLASQFSNCCCQTQKAIMEQGYQGQIATLNQTAAMNNGFAGVNTNIAATKAAQQLSDCQQTYALTDTMNRNYIALDNKLDAMESGRKDREITALTAKVAQLESQNFTVSALGQAVAPINAQLASLSKEVDDIKCKQPSTVSVQYPNLVALNATPYVSGGFYGNGYGYNGNGWFGNGWNNGINF
jgi:hypothetical protein